MVGILPTDENDRDRRFDAVVVTHLTGARNVFDQAVSNFGAEKVLAPDLLGLRPRQQQGAA
jgi:hypothetical protein